MPGPPPIGSLLVAAVLALVYALGHRLSRLDPGTVRRWPRHAVSAAGGAAVAYVFVDVLPELGTGHRALIGSAGEDLLFAKQRIYVMALLGFVIFYGLEQLVLPARGRRREELTGRGDAAYRLRLGGFAVYSCLIGYLLVSRATLGPVALVLYGAAMAFHFLVVDHSLRQEHGAPYDRAGRWMLAGSVLVGWLIGVTVHVAEVPLARLFAFVAGGVVITSVRAELPHRGEGRFWSFCLGSAAYALLLILAS